MLGLCWKATRLNPREDKPAKWNGLYAGLNWYYETQIFLADFAVLERVLKLKPIKFATMAASIVVQIQPNQHKYENESLQFSTPIRGRLRDFAVNANKFPRTILTKSLEF